MRPSTTPHLCLLAALTVTGLTACAHRAEAAAPRLVDTPPEVIPDPMLAPAVPAALNGDWQPTPEEDAIYRALSARDPLSCEAVEALASEPVAVLLTVVEKAEMPPWASLRAATCLAAGHAEAVREQLLAWVGAEQTKGLAWVALEQLDQMPEALALELAGSALAGPNAEEAAKPIAACTYDTVRALLP